VSSFFLFVVFCRLSSTFTFFILVSFFFCYFLLFLYFLKVSKLKGLILFLYTVHTTLNTTMYPYNFRVLKFKTIFIFTWKNSSLECISGHYTDTIVHDKYKYNFNRIIQAVFHSYIKYQWIFKCLISVLSPY